MKNNYGSYSFKVWIFTLILASLIGIITSSIYYDEFGGGEMLTAIILLTLSYGTFLSLPFYLLFTLVNMFLFKTNISPLRLKIYLTLFIPLFIGTVWSISFGFQSDRDSLLYMSCTLFVVIIGIWIFKIEKEVRPHFPSEDNDILDDIDFEK